jgi:parallel beta-helix repeat protein
VASGGEIWLLDSGNYNTGPVAVTKSVTILAVPGALGSVVALGGDALVIATPGVKVALRNLVIVPFPGGGGVNGVNMTDGALLTIENCLIANLPLSGISVNASAVVRVTDTTIRDNGGHGLALNNGARGTVTRSTISGNTIVGVLVSGNAANTTTADIASSTIDGNDYGVFALSSAVTAMVKVSVRDSRVVTSGTHGLLARSDLGAAVTLSASNNIVSNNGTGITAMSAGSKVWASGNTVSDNGTGLSNSSGLFESASSNAVRNNTTDTSGAITPISPI